MAQTTPQQPLKETALKGLGPSTVAKLEKLGIVVLQDLLFHLPSRYQDRTRITPIGALREGMEVVVQGRVLICDTVQGRRRSLLCKIEDGTGMVSLRFFHFTQAQKNNLQKGMLLRCFGEVRRGSSGLEFYHPEYSRLSEEEPQQDAPIARHLTPIYPTTEGLSQNKLRQLTRQALDLVKDGALAHELLIRAPHKQHQNLSLLSILALLHYPPTDQMTAQELERIRVGQHPLQQLLALEELVAYQLTMLRSRQRVRQQRAPQMPLQNLLVDQFCATLPFSLTGAQQRVIKEIGQDMACPQPMLRLLQGDVGAGKTLVAACVTLQAVAAGSQVALMAPTEILAEQHLVNFSRWMQPLGLKVAWLSGKQSAKEKRESSALISSGSAQIVIGTHALFQKEVQFQNLGLVVIDEQHRFGVHQRLALLEKGRQQGLVPHQLIMTATPIPRTLAMSAYADLDCSIIDQLPPGRLAIETLLINAQRRDEIIERVRRACSEGRQAYWVCTLIEESEALQCQAAEVTAQLLTQALPELRIGLVHGRLKSDEKNRVMQAFSEGALQLLVATTVIEVGVDVPNASLMIIENPERLGLAQLHQLRGRVGRGAIQSYCLLMYSEPLSTDSKARLAIMRQSQDGFVIAEKDLEMRGPGEILGTRQTGAMQFKIADLQRDQTLIPTAQQEAQHILQQHPQRVPLLIERWRPSHQPYVQV